MDWNKNALRRTSNLMAATVVLGLGFADVEKGSLTSFAGASAQEQGEKSRAAEVGKQLRKDGAAIFDFFKDFQEGVQGLGSKALDGAGEVYAGETRGEIENKLGIAKKLMETEAGRKILKEAAKAKIRQKYEEFGLDKAVDNFKKGWDIGITSGKCKDAQGMMAFALEFDEGIFVDVYNSFVDNWDSLSEPPKNGLIEFLDNLKKVKMGQGASEEQVNNLSYDYFLENIEDIITPPKERDWNYCLSGFKGDKVDPGGAAYAFFARQRGMIFSGLEEIDDGELIGRFDGLFPDVSREFDLHK